MKRTVWIALLVVVVIGLAAVAPQAAKAWGPCDGPYGGYAGCNYNGGYNTGYYGGDNVSGYHNYQPGYTYNRVCYWYGYGAYRHLYCTYVRVPAYSPYYSYGYAPYNPVYYHMPYKGYGGYGMYAGY